MKYFKLFNKEDTYSIQYQNGLNIDNSLCNGDISLRDLCVKDRLYFLNAKHIMDYLDDTSYYIREVEVPAGAYSIGASNGGIASSLYLHERRSLYEAETWEWLKEQGVGIDKALIWAAATGKTEIITILIDAGANQNFKNEDGKTYKDYMEQ